MTHLPLGRLSRRIPERRHKGAPSKNSHAHVSKIDDETTAKIH
jgi:hypothetical protein